MREGLEREGERGTRIVCDGDLPVGVGSGLMGAVYARGGGRGFVALIGAGKRVCYTLVRGDDVRVPLTGLGELHRSPV